MIIGDGNLSLGDALIVIVVFVLIAGCTVLIPVVGYLMASARMAGPWTSCGNGWLTTTPRSWPSCFS